MLKRRDPGAQPKRQPRSVRPELVEGRWFDRLTTNGFPAALLGWVLLAGASLLIATACGATPAAGAPAGQAPPSNPAAAPAPAPAPNAPAASAPAAAPVDAGAGNPGTASQAGGQASTDRLAKGKEVFEKTAGGVGCAYCHGMDGKGAGPSGLNAPPIRGKTEAHVRDAVSNIVMMSFVKLNEEEIVAVGAYLQYLGTQP